MVYMYYSIYIYIFITWFKDITRECFMVFMVEKISPKIRSFWLKSPLEIHQNQQNSLFKL